MSIHLVPSSQLSFKRPLINGARETLLVINSGNDPVMFKVKTTAPKQYTVKPNAGRIEPQSQVEVQVMLQSFKEEPQPDYKCRDKFLVQWAPIKPVYEALPISEMWGITELEDKEAIHQQKLKVHFLYPISTLDEEPEEAEVVTDQSPVVEPAVVHHQPTPEPMEEHQPAIPSVEEEVQQQQPQQQPQQYLQQQLQQQPLQQPLQQEQHYYHHSEEPAARISERTTPIGVVEAEKTLNGLAEEEPKKEDGEKTRLQHELATMKSLVDKLKKDLSSLKHQDRTSTPSTEKIHNKLTALETPQTIEGYTPQMMLTIAALVFVVTYLFF